MKTYLLPRRALAHPLWVAALAVLVANDHFLKTAGVLPGVITGKLSDIAGLFVAPAVLAALLCVSTRRGVLLAHIATGAVFALIKISPSAARALEALMAFTPFTWRITVDPTDLIALPMLAVSYLVLVPRMRSAHACPGRRDLPASGAAEPIAQRVLLMTGAVACMATSQVPPEPNPCFEGAEFCNNPALESGALVLGNATQEERLVRVRHLKDTVTVDCDALMANPTTALSRELFKPAEAWLIQPNRALILENSAGCSAFLVDADGMDMALLAWRETNLPTAELTTSLSSNNGDRQIVLRLNENIGRLELAPHPAIVEAPPVEDPGPTKSCETPGDEAAVAWSTPLLVGIRTITDVSLSPDGCTGVDLDNAPRFYLCVPEGAFPFKAGDSITISTWQAPTDEASYPEAAGAPVDATGILLEGASASMIVSRGNVLPRWDSPDLEGYSAETDRVTGCAGSHDACGDLVIPVDVSLFGGAASEITVLRAGDKATLGQGVGTLYLVRAQAMPIRDSACAPTGAGETLLESVLVRTK